MIPSPISFTFATSMTTPRFGSIKPSYFCLTAFSTASFTSNWKNLGGTLMWSCTSIL